MQQDEIRNRTTDAKHCRYLSRNPNACVNFNERSPQATHEQPGMLCPMNPLFIKGEPIRKGSASDRQAVAELYEMAADLYAHHRVQPFAFTDLSPEEYELLRIHGEQHEARMLRMQSKMIGQEVARVVGMMFGAKENG